MSYDPTDALGGGAWSFIETVTVSNQAAVEMDLSGTHKMYMFHIDNLIPISDSQELRMRFSTDLGSTFLAATNYEWALSGTRGSSAISLGERSTAATSQINLTPSSFGSMGSATAESLNGFVYIHNANQTTNAVCATFEIGVKDSSTVVSGWAGSGALLSNIDEVDAVQFIAASGNLDEGRISLYGLNLS
jgi:hypothetical protein